jgi:uncharacterized protein (DUF4415 family)
MKTEPDDRARELAALAELPEDTIDTSDLPETEDWGGAKRGRFYRPFKRSITMRLDVDVIDWLRRREPKCQTAISRVLREHMMSRASGSSKESRPR